MPPGLIDAAMPHTPPAPARAAAPKHAATRPVRRSLLADLRAVEDDETLQAMHNEPAPFEFAAYGGVQRRMHLAAQHSFLAAQSQDVTQ